MAPVAPPGDPFRPRSPAQQVVGFWWRSWTLVAIRIVVEGLFVAAVPVGLFLAVACPGLRILLADFVAAPAYSDVKLASFKFFMEMYRSYPLVHEEDRDDSAHLGL